MNGLRGGGSTEGVGPELQDRIRCSKTWAEWSPGLVAAIQESLRRWTALAKSSGDSVGDSVGVKKMDLEFWKKTRAESAPTFSARLSPLYGTDGAGILHIIGRPGIEPVMCSRWTLWDPYHLVMMLDGAPGNGIPPI